MTKVDKLGQFFLPNVILNEVKDTDSSSRHGGAQNDTQNGMLQ